MDKTKWMHIAKQLVFVTMVYNLLEAGLALWSGIRAGSIALVGFGLDSVIELAAALVLFRRLHLETAGAEPEMVERSERRVQRFVGATFMVLAVYVTLQSAWTLFLQDAPSESLIGIVLAGFSLVIMPLVSIGKLRAADKLQSKALRAEAKETLACSYLSFTLLLGLAANAWIGWWWADPVAALLMVPWLVKEGLEGIRGGCCCEQD